MGQEEQHLLGTSPPPRAISGLPSEKLRVQFPALLGSGVPGQGRGVGEWRRSDLAKVSQQVSGRTAEQLVPQSPALPALAASRHSATPTPKVCDPGRTLRPAACP